LKEANASVIYMASTYATGAKVFSKSMSLIWM